MQKTKFIAKNHTIIYIYREREREREREKDFIIIILIFIIIIITQHLLPPSLGRHASCHEMSYSKRETKPKKEEKKFPFMPFKL